jgi:hypothetical protein
MEFVKRGEPFTQGRLAGGHFQLGLDLLVEALQFVALPSQVRPLTRQGHFHLANFGHELFFIAFELFAFAEELLLQSEEFFLAGYAAVGTGALFGELQFLVELPNQFAFLFQEGLVFLLALAPACSFPLHECQAFAGLVEGGAEPAVFFLKANQFAVGVLSGTRLFVQQGDNHA